MVIMHFSGQHGSAEKPTEAVRVDWFSDSCVPGYIRDTGCAEICKTNRNGETRMGNNIARERLKDKKRIVLKIGSSSLTHEATGDLNLHKIEHLVRLIADLKGLGKEVVLVSSGAVAAGRQALGAQKAQTVAEKQAHAAVGQARLMMVYQRMFSEYNHTAAQILMTKDTIVRETSRENATNTFNELLKLGTVPIVNENDTVSTHEIKFGDNDRLSAIVAALIGADLLILLSDIDGLYSDDPKSNPDAVFIEQVDALTDELMGMGKATTGSDVGTGGMAAKLYAAKIATQSGCDMVITNADHLEVVWDITVEGKNVGTLFTAHKTDEFDLVEYVESIH